MSPRVGNPGVEALVDVYRESLVAAGLFSANPVTSVARSFFARIGSDGWERLSLTEQCGLTNKDRRVVGWLMVTGRLSGSADYLTRSRLAVGEMAGRVRILVRRPEDVGVGVAGKGRQPECWCLRIGVGTGVPAVQYRFVLMRQQDIAQQRVHGHRRDLGVHADRLPLGREHPCDGDPLGLVGGLQSEGQLDGAATQ